MPPRSAKRPKYIEEIAFESDDEPANASPECAARCPHPRPVPHLMCPPRFALSDLQCPDGCSDRSVRPGASDWRQFDAHSPTIPTVHLHPRSLIQLYTLLRSYGDNPWPAIKILNHRVIRGKTEVQIKWKGINPESGEPWDLTWEPEENATPALLTAYYATAVQLKPHYTSCAVDVTPLYVAMMLSITRAVTLGKTKCRANVHKIPLDEVRLWELAVELAQWLAKYLGVKIETTEVGGCECLTIKITTMAQVDKLCSFEHFIDNRKAAGALNFDIGRESNVRIASSSAPKCSSPSSRTRSTRSSVRPRSSSRRPRSTASTARSTTRSCPRACSRRRSTGTRSWRT
jgi:hypothetical protein